MLMPQAKSQLNKKGFTLIELLVSIAVFSIAITMGITAVITVVNANRSSQSSNLAMSNLSLAIESMNRSIRVGYDYQIDTNSLTFKPSSGVGTWTYRWDSNNHAIVRDVEDINGNVQTSTVTAPEVVIENMDFKLMSAADEQPRVLILIKGRALTNNDQNKSFYLQTMVSQRLIPSI